MTVTIIALFFHSMAGYALARLRFPGRDVIFLAMFATFLISLPVIIVPLFILVRALGMLNSYAGLIIPAIFNAFGIFLLRQFYLAVPRELEEAAVVDGCGYFRVYWSIILPLSRPILGGARRSSSSSPTGTHSSGRSPSPATKSSGSFRSRWRAFVANTARRGTTSWRPRRSSRCRR